MRRTASLFVLLWAMLGAATPRPALAEPPPLVERGATPASAAELGRYQERERQAPGLEEFEGGRRATIAVSTVIIILLVVIIVLIVI